MRTRLSAAVLLSTFLFNVSAFSQSRTVLNNPAVQTDVNMAGHGLTNVGSTGGLAVTVDANGLVTNVLPTNFPSGHLLINGVAVVFPASSTATASNWIRAYDSATGLFSKSQPAFSDLSGSAAIGQLPTGTTSSTVAT